MICPICQNDHLPARTKPETVRAYDGEAVLVDDSSWNVVEDGADEWWATLEADDLNPQEFTYARSVVPFVFEPEVDAQDVIDTSIESVSAESFEDGFEFDPPEGSVAELQAALDAVTEAWAAKHGATNNCQAGPIYCLWNERAEWCAWHGMESDK